MKKSTNTLFRGCLLASLFCAFPLCLSAQAPAIQWENTIGGSDDDNRGFTRPTTDGGYIIGGISASNISGDKTENGHGFWDYWVVKVDSLGVIQWQNTVGGSNADWLEEIQQTSDGGYILGGYSLSNISGDKTENSQGDMDYWVVKLDFMGVIEWQNTIGGTGGDYLISVQEITGLESGGYILGGYSNSNISGDKTENSQGSFDYWVVKLNQVGAIQWQNTIGGAGYDRLTCLEKTMGGGYIIGGYSTSNISGDKTENCQGLDDFWVVKLNSGGVIQWQNTIGGSNYDRLRSVQQTGDGGYILGGWSQSNISGDKTENSQGYQDYWVVNLNEFGDIRWQNTIGGNGADFAYSVQETSGDGYFVGGWSDSNISGDKTENSQGSIDYWVLKLGVTGNIQWQKSIGGAGNDECYSVEQTFDGGYILGGYSDSNISGDKTENCIGVRDYWIVKLFPGPSCIPVTEICNDTDDDCDGLVDEGLASTFYADSDGDTYGNLAVAQTACTAPGGYVSNNTDCDDSDPAIHPGSTEVCNALDDDCDLLVDEGVQTTFYADSDGDTYGNPAVPQLACAAPSGYVPNNGDCDDSDPAIHPGSTEVCNSTDDDCDLLVDEGISTSTYYADADGDTYGSPAVSQLACAVPGGYVSNNTDCNDSDAAVHPGATETCNGTDDDCDGTIDGPLAVFLVSKTNVSCNGGSNGAINISETCGLAPYSFLWSNGAATEDVSGLAAGTYTVTVTDSQGLEQTFDATITQPAATNLTYTLNKPSCAGGSNGSIKVNPPAPASAHTFLWNTGSNAQTLASVSAGTYTVTVTKTTTGCTTVGTATLTQPLPVAVSMTKTDILCNGQTNGTAKALATGGTGLKTYLWSNSTTSTSITGLTAGAYTVTATDLKGCTASATTTIIEPAAVVLTVASIVPVSGGKWKVTLAATGGTPISIAQPYRYRLRPTGGAWGAWKASAIFNNLLPSVYDFEMKDKNTCILGITTTVPPLLRPANTVGRTGKTGVDFTLYPNPVENQLVVQAGTMITMANRVQIFDAVGRLVAEQGWPAGDISLQIPTTNWAPGVFVATIVAEDGSVLAVLRGVKTE